VQIDTVRFDGFTVALGEQPYRVSKQPARQDGN
jgi:hypothetical protein